MKPEGLSPKRGLAILAVLYLLMFWSDLPTFRPGMDSMTYGTVSRHFLTIGDWAVPHYVEQACLDFFMHPPLALWITAFTMKIATFFAGSEALWSDAILKVGSSLFGAGCVAIVYLWARRLRGESYALLAGIVLLTSTRFVKYSKGLMLDPFLAFFSLLAVWLACLGRDEREGKGILAFFSGLSITAALLSKGLFAFCPLGVILWVYFLDVMAAPRGTGTAKRTQARLGLYLVGVAIPFLAWFQLGGGPRYISRYFIEHVSTRVGHHSLIEHLAADLNLLKVYWPWLPFLVLGFVRIASPLRQQPTLRRAIGILRSEEGIVALTAFGFIAGFTLAGSFLEQYHVATYPFAALVVIYGIPSSWARFRVPAERAVIALLAVAALAVLIAPEKFRSGESQNPIRIALHQAHLRCRSNEIRRITISTGVAEIWYALAIGGWYTQWDPYSAPATLSPDANRSQLLLARADETASKEWSPTGIHAGPFVVLQSPGAPKCDLSR